MDNSGQLFLSQLVPINVKFSRSTRIDADSLSSAEFVYSDTIDRFLNTLASHQEGENKQGAYTWTGPYGSGKSTLALSLLTILQGTTEERRLAAKEYNPKTAERVWSAFSPRDKPWKCLTIIGDRTSFCETLETSAKAAGLIEEKVFKSPKELVFAISEHAKSLQNNAGVIIFVDEMGKLLEYAISNQEDVYIYQLLAEAAARSEGKLVFVGILHQTFQEYASNAIKKVKAEWAKVQGRFVDISFNLSGTEQLDLLSKAIGTENTPVEFAALNVNVVEYLAQQNRSPSEDYATMLDRCWPLNPLVAICLGPISRRSYGQNQRSLFSFLSSGEPLGFSSFLSENLFQDSKTRTFKLSNLWDYLKFNWGNLISASQDSHSFAIVSDLLNQLENLRGKDRILPDSSEDIIKAVHLLHMTRQQTGLTPTAKAIAFSLEVSEEEARDYLTILVDLSLLSFRSFNASYALNEGSDFDLETVLEEQLDKSDDLNLSELSKEFLPSTLIGKRHYLLTGALRWATISLCSYETAVEIVEQYSPDNSNFCKFILMLDDIEPILSNYQKFSCNGQFFVGRVNVSDVAFETLKEFHALKRIQEKRAELTRDRVARREVRERLDARRVELETIFSDSLENTNWHRLDNGEVVKENRLSKIVSDCADEVFKSSIQLSNELINRNKVSGTANGAIKKLLCDLIEKEGLEDLGYTKFPAERALFETIFLNTGLYSKKYKTWQFVTPQNAGSQFGENLENMFSVTLEYLKSNSTRTVSFSEIQEEIWSKPPFGVKFGLFPVYIFIFLKTHSAKIAYYRDEIFSTSINDVDVDFFIRTPKYCGVRYLDMDFKTKAVLTVLASIPARLEQSEIESIEPLEVARNLVAVYDKIPDWPKRSSKVSDNAKRIRNAFSRASDPAQFTLVDIPNLFGIIDMEDADALNEMCSKVYDGLKELQELQGNFIKDLHAHLMKELGVFPLNQNMLDLLHERATTIQRLSGDARMDAFITNVKSLSLETGSTERIASLLINKPAKAWIDNDVDQIMVEATSKARQFISLETMSHIQGKKNYRKAMSLVSFDGENQTGVVTEVALSNVDISEGRMLASDLQQSTYGTRLKNKQHLIAMLMVILEHGDFDG